MKGENLEFSGQAFYEGKNFTIKLKDFKDKWLIIIFFT